MIMIKYFLSVLLIFMPSYQAIYAWGDVGNMVVAKIAKEHLDPEVDKEVEALSELLGTFYPESRTFITSACWADDLSQFGVHAFDSWHYIVIPYDPERILSKEQLLLLKVKNDRCNLVWAIDECIETLTSPKSGPFEKAIMLRFFIHFVANIHQPLQCTTLFSKQFPNGDRGGKLFQIIGTHSKDLQSYWDSGIGLFPDPINRPLNEKSQRLLQSLADQMTAYYPFDKAKGKLNDEIANWAQESHLLGVTVCYNIAEGSQPSAEYIQTARNVVHQQTSLAGYRLAYLLNRYFKKPKKTT
jgi:hypothetical protein